MNFLELQNELVEIRFGAAKRENVKRWLNHRMGMVWAHADWPFKKVERTLFTVTDGIVNLPPDFRRATWVESATGSVLDPVTPHDFRVMYDMGNHELTSEPSIFTVVNGRLTVRPSGAAQVYVAYERKLSHATLAGGDYFPQPGHMSADSDKPLWDEDFHYILPLGAMSTGLKTENDPTWDSLEGEYRDALMHMMEEYLPPEGIGVNKQYGRVWD